MGKEQGDVLGMLIVLALLLLFLNPRVRSLWPALFTHRTVVTNLNPLQGLGVNVNLPFGQSASANVTTPQPTPAGGM